MSDEPLGRWLPVFASDAQIGDLVRFDGVERRITHRDYPAWTPFFTLTFPGGTTRGLAKTAKIEIFDPDGTVARRVHVLPDR